MKTNGLNFNKWQTLNSIVSKIIFIKNAVIHGIDTWSDRSRHLFFIIYFIYVKKIFNNSKTEKHIGSFEH